MWWLDRDYFHAKRRRHDLDCAPLTDPDGYRRIPNDRRSHHPGRELLSSSSHFAPMPYSNGVNLPAAN